MDRGTLRRTVLVRFGGGAVVLGALLFVPAGTLRWWEAWLFLGTLFIPMALVAGYLYRNDPALLERRLMRREERSRQRAIVWVGSAVWLVSFLFPAFDQRFGWSSVPAGLAVVGDGLVLAGYLVFFLTMRENSFAARVVQVEEGQRVISTGPYAVVRHPMYSGISLMWVATPLALGSWWGVIPALTTPLFLAVRLLDEEKALAAALPGYVEYAHTVRWRLVPGVW
jgi:protein-S-isoprenylcysteine O-methyltransferase Ste14